MNIWKKFVFQQAMSIKSWAKTKKNRCRRMKSWPNVASRQLQSCKKEQQNYRDIAGKAKFSPPYLKQAAKTYVATSHSVVRPETIEISEQRTAFVWLFAQEVDMMSERLWQAALADHCINQPLKKLRWSYWRLIWRHNSFDMYHWAPGRSEKFHFDEFEN